MKGSGRAKLGGDVQITEEKRRSLAYLERTTEYICTSGAIRSEWPACIRIK